MERSLGLGKTAKWLNLLLIRLFGDTMFVGRCLETRSGEKLHAEQEFDNLMDNFVVKVTKKTAKRSAICLASTGTREYPGIFVVERHVLK